MGSVVAPIASLYTGVDLPLQLKNTCVGELLPCIQGWTVTPSSYKFPNVIASLYTGVDRLNILHLMGQPHCFPVYRGGPADHHAILGRRLLLPCIQGWTVYAFIERHLRFIASLYTGVDLDIRACRLYGFFPCMQGFLSCDL